MNQPQNKYPLALIGNASLACAVLDDGTRVISERGLLAGLGIKAGGELSKAGKGELDGAAGLPLFVAHRVLKPFIDKDLAVLLQNPILYRAIQGGKPAHGLKAELIPQVCNVWLKARDAGVLTTESQKRIAVSADILMRGLANVGIVALVDEASRSVKPLASSHSHLTRLVTETSSGRIGNTVCLFRKAACG